MTEHYFSEKPASEIKIFRIEAKLLGIDMQIHSVSGIFSAKELDKGTSLLIESAVVKKDWDVLDLGCGNGIVGIAMEKVYGAKVTMSDINERAIMIAKRNVKDLGLKAQVVKSDGFAKIDALFSTILFNPPQTAGRQICEKMIADSMLHLKPGGMLQVVARHNKGGRQLSIFMNEVFGNVKYTAKKGGFRVYVSSLQKIQHEIPALFLDS
jgi:16S rRNA G1207 methylase RsmC